MATDWSWPLTRTLTLKSGEQLRTLRDATNLSACASVARTLHAHENVLRFGASRFISDRTRRPASGWSGRAEPPQPHDGPSSVTAM